MPPSDKSPISKELMKTLLSDKLCEFIKIPPKLLEISAFKRGKKGFFDLYEISDFPIKNYMWNIIIHMADAKYLF